MSAKVQPGGEKIAIKGKLRNIVEIVENHRYLLFCCEWLRLGELRASFKTDCLSNELLVQLCNEYKYKENYFVLGQSRILTNHK